jgi:hypothetical protein
MVLFLIKKIIDCQGTGGEPVPANCGHCARRGKPTNFFTICLHFLAFLCAKGFISSESHKNSNISGTYLLTERKKFIEKLAKKIIGSSFY